jgi:anoctamin-10/anoctamin-7
MLIVKTFLFQFVNSYFSLFYIAFVKGYLSSDHCIGGCMVELSTQLGIIFMTRLVSGNAMEILGPYRANKKREKEELGESDAERLRTLSVAEKQYILQEYDPMMGTFDDYAEMIVQFGYASLFVAAFPLAPLMAFVNNYIELRVDGWKLCQQNRRPMPRGAQDIGRWYAILECMSTAAVICNCLLVCFTSDVLQSFTMFHRLLLFVISEHALFAFKFFLALIIDDEELEVGMQSKRGEYIRSKIFDNVKDDDDTSLVAGVGIDMDMTVNLVDDMFKVVTKNKAPKKKQQTLELGEFKGDEARV